MPAVLHLPTRITGTALIEPLVAATVAGLLAATALPRLVELLPLAGQAVLAHNAAAMARAMNGNAAGCLASGGQAQPGLCQPVTDCAEVALLLQGGVPPGYQVLPQPLTGGGRIGEADTRCTLRQQDGGAEAGFIGLRAGR